MEGECAKLEEDLRGEKARIRALTEELEHPINVHRWRALADRDPPKWALIQRMHEVQRRVLEVRDAIAARDAEVRAGEAEAALAEAGWNVEYFAEVPAAPGTMGRTYQCGIWGCS